MNGASGHRLGVYERASESHQSPALPFQPQPTHTQHPMKPAQLKLLSNLCFILGFASILGSIAIWFLTGGQAPDTQAHAERFGIFVGLWAPTLFILSNRFDRYAEKAA
jgi:hypothetical protein